MSFGAEVSYYQIILSLWDQHLVKIQFLIQFVCLFLVKNIEFPVEQCQMALWVFLMAHCVWLVFAIQLVLKDQYFSLFFFLMCLTNASCSFTDILIRNEEN